MKMEYEFTLPRGYLDKEGTLHQKGSMRLATSGDELFSMKDARVRLNSDYLQVIILSKVITGLGSLENVTPEIIEQLFIADYNFLCMMYQDINQAKINMHVQCPHCGESFTQAINYTEHEE